MLPSRHSRDAPPTDRAGDAVARPARFSRNSGALRKLRRPALPPTLAGRAPSRSFCPRRRDSPAGVRGVRHPSLGRQRRTLCLATLAAGDASAQERGRDLWDGHCSRCLADCWRGFSREVDTSRRAQGGCARVRGAMCVGEYARAHHARAGVCLTLTDDSHSTDERANNSGCAGWSLRPRPRGWPRVCSRRPAVGCNPS